MKSDMFDCWIWDIKDLADNKVIIKLEINKEYLDKKFGCDTPNIMKYYEKKI